MTSGVYLDQIKLINPSNSKYLEQRITLCNLLLDQLPETCTNRKYLIKEARRETTKLAIDAKVVGDRLAYVDHQYRNFQTKQEFEQVRYLLMFGRATIREDES
jgi:hypothetical protein